MFFEWAAFKTLCFVLKRALIIRGMDTEMGRPEGLDGAGQGIVKVIGAAWWRGGCGVGR